VRIVFTADFENTRDKENTHKASLAFAVPRDLPHQKLLGKCIYNPKPVKFRKDKWNQEFAHFKVPPLKPGEHHVVEVSFPVSVHTITQYFFPEDVGTKEEIPEDIRKRYLADGEKLKITHPVVMKALAESLGNETNLYWGMRRILEYVTDHVTFELDGRWDAAPIVLETGKGSCSEYTYVFMAICRAWGLPARYAGGTCRREDDASSDFSYHRWAQVYLPRIGWIDVDANAGDNPLAIRQSDAIGRLGSGLVINTISGGDSEVIGWGYLSTETGSADAEYQPSCDQHVEWEPLR
jgi:transglutaminase-like putative cysteine protease